MKVLKFGGSSVSTAERIINVVKILQVSKTESDQIHVVFSAFGGVTDDLIKMANLAAESQKEYLNSLQSFEDRCSDIIHALFTKTKRKNIQVEVGKRLQELRDILHGIFLLHDLTPRTMDLAMSFGERISAPVICQVMSVRGMAAAFLDARKLVKTDNQFGAARVNMKKTEKNIRDYFQDKKTIQVITGFLGSTEQNETTTLGRGGSDYTAAIFCAALNAEEIEIWTDVDGVMTTNPAMVKKAFSLEQISYEEAMELSHFGAKVIHPPTMQPAMQKKIPIRIRNTFNPSFQGTLISSRSLPSQYPVKGISSISDIALLRVQGGGMVGVTGIAGRLFGALARAKINIILITQGSSEHSICFAVEPKDAQRAKKVIEEEFELETKVRRIDEVVVEKDLSIVAIVGENMRHTPGISGNLFGALGRNGINVIAIAQGSSELNISVVVDKADEAKALNALHDVFFLSDTKSVNLFIVGTGLIGSTLLRQILSHVAQLRKDHALEIRMVGLADKDHMVFREDGIPLDDYEKRLCSGETTEMKNFVAKMKSLNLSNCIFVDCTAADQVVSYYEKILDSNISIVTPNKKAASSQYQSYRKLKALAQKRRIPFLYETNVGAGLPIINTLQSMIASGDKIKKIEAVLSGTLSYIFNNFDGTQTFSQVIREAREKGYTEPDPRDDLNGLDVARKLLILARETGLELELNDIEVENLVPEPCRSARSFDEFLDRLQVFDEEFARRRHQAQKAGKVLRYIARFENSQASVSLQAVGPDHPFYSLTGSDNIVAFTSERYSDRPLVVKGPGAGAEVTAAGVLADILHAAKALF